jgi:cell division GTPase FtsZ
MADDILRQGIQGISELITVPGLINLDFADVKTIMSMGGAALMAVGEAPAMNAPATRPRRRCRAACWISPSTARAASCSTSPAART